MPLDAVEKMFQICRVQQVSDDPIKRDEKARFRDSSSTGSGLSNNLPNTRYRVGQSLEDRPRCGVSCGGVFPLPFELCCEEAATSCGVTARTSQAGADG